jgi:hypothetical protein
MEKQIFVYENSPRWNLLIEDGKLLITKGADEIYLIEELTGKDSEIIYESYKNRKIHEIKANTTDEKILGVISKLEKAGVIYKKSEGTDSSKPVNFSVIWIGNPNQKVFSLLEQFSKNTEQLRFATGVNSPDILIMIRTSTKLAEAMKDYKKIKLPHLFVDIAYDHTLSLGPLVFPGETACLGCFIGRITRNWGDAEPPQLPNVSDSHELIASMILEQMRTFQKIGSCPELIEKATTFNLSDLTTKTDSVFRLPWCPICYPDKLKEGLGSFELPWKINDNQV